MYAEARDSFLKSAELGRDSADMYYKLGNISMKENNPAKAAEFWKKSLQLNPSNEIIKKNLKLLTGESL